MMNIYIIIGHGYTKDDVIEEIRQEGYNDSFFFPEKVDIKSRKKAMNQADEIWVFGDAKNYDDYIYAKEKGYDIWQMG